MIWTSLPPMSTPRKYCQGEMVTYPDGSQGILVTGGQHVNTAEFLNLDTLLWEPKQRMSYDVYGAVAVPYQQSYILVGGSSFDVESRQTNLMYYNPELDRWELQYEELRDTRFNFASLTVPPAYLTCN